jgi:phospholipase C
MAEENRSLDSYFGALRQYWAQNGYADESFDGLPQFNPVDGAKPHYGPPPSLPGCNPNSPAPSDCVWDPDHPVASFHYLTECTENVTASWTNAHIDWNYYDPLGNHPAAMNGFVLTAAQGARLAAGGPAHDVEGRRAMGYYDGHDLNYYYFMASNFATSDRWFQPVMSNTAPNRGYMIAGTSGGYVYRLGTNRADDSPLDVKTIFQQLQSAGITWKIYVNPVGSPCQGPPYDPACLVTLSYLWGFTFYDEAVENYPEHIAPISEYFSDVKNGTLPQVAEIAEGGPDEHPGENVQLGAQYVSTLINALMQSPSWTDSAFILTYDESSGLYDHVSPQREPSPDGIKPLDLEHGQTCANSSGPTCDFVYSGGRIPLIVVSPFTKKHYVSHTVADTTAILKLIETRFNLPPLTRRDAAQMDMLEFFDFDDPPWMTPPTPPAQNMDGACYDDHLP